MLFILQLYNSYQLDVLFFSFPYGLCRTRFRVFSFPQKISSSSPSLSIRSFLRFSISSCLPHWCFSILFTYTSVSFTSDIMVGCTYISLLLLPFHPDNHIRPDLPELGNPLGTRLSTYRSPPHSLSHYFSHSVLPIHSYHMSSKSYYLESYFFSDTVCHLIFVPIFEVGYKLFCKAYP